MQNEGRSSTGSVLPGENDIAIPFEADDTYIDMDISPINFPNSSADIHSSLESKPPESHGASGIMSGDQGSPYLPSDRVENWTCESSNSCFYHHICKNGLLV